MKQESIHARSRSLIILLTILIHLLLLLLLIVPHTPLFINQELEQKFEQLHQKIQKIDPHTPWVNVPAQTPSQGAPVILVHDDEPTNNTSSDDTHTADTKTQATIQVDDQKIKKTVETEVEIPENMQEISRDLTVPATTKISHHEQLPYDPDYVPSSLFNSPSPRQRRNTTPTSDRSKVTLATLAKNFNKHHTQEPSTIIRTGTISLSISMIGDPTNNAKISEHQLKEGRYLEKVAACIENSCRIHARECPMRRPTSWPRIAITLEKNGSLSDMFVAQSSGDIAMDKFIMYIMKEASTSFPPIPAFLGDKPRKYCVIF